MKKLIPIRRIIEDARENGDDIDSIFVDPDDICSVDPDELDDPEENSDEDEE